MQFFEDDSIKLFNLKNDIGEKNDLANSQPEKTASLLEELQAWQKRTKAVIPACSTRTLTPETVNTNSPGVFMLMS